MRYLQADKIFDGMDYLPQGSLLAVDATGALTAVLPPGSVDVAGVESYNGIITPGFVNSHCHLELSHLRGQIPEHTGLPGFARHVITKRKLLNREQTAEHMEKADDEMWRNGIVAVGDIGNTEDSFSLKQVSKIYYHSFIELIGLDPAGANTAFEHGLLLLKKLEALGLSGSLAPHAPYSTSNKLIRQIADFDLKHSSPFSIHNQESDDETKFFQGEPNGFEELFRFLGLDISWFRAPGHSSLEDYAGHLSAGASLLVHNTTTSFRDIELVSAKNVFWCFCPNANVYIENRLPAFDTFKTFKHKVCLGTDSLAGNHQLNLVSEANTMLRATSTFSAEDLLRSMTSQGASALGLEKNFGSLINGKNTGLNLVQIHDSEIRFIKKIT